MAENAKTSVERIERVVTPDAEKGVGIPAPDPKDEKALVRKCDKHVLPCITLLFFLSFLDRTNIGK